MQFHKVTLSEGQIALIKSALYELGLQLKMAPTRQRCREVVEVLIEAETRTINAPEALEVVR